MKERCFNILRLEPTATPLEVRTRWRELAFDAHPDRSHDTEAFLNLKAAYERCLSISRQPRTCLNCQGKGKLARGKGFHTAWLKCPKCKGTGQKALE